MHTFDPDILTKYRIDFPKRRIDNVYAHNANILAVVELDKGWPQRGYIIGKNPLTNRDSLCTSLKEALSLLLLLRLTKVPEFPGHPVEFIGLPIQCSFSRNADVLRTIRINERREVHAFHAFPAGIAQGIKGIALVADKAKSCAVLQMQLHMRPEFQCSGIPDTCRNFHPAAARLRHIINGLLNGLAMK